MTTLAKDAIRVYSVGVGEYTRMFPVAAADIIYEGAGVGLATTGLAGPHTLTAGTYPSFVGFAVKKADNSAGAASAIDVEVMVKGRVKINVATVDGIDDLGKTVYAADDDSWTLVSTGAEAIGKIDQWLSGTLCVVAFEGVTVRSL